MIETGMENKWYAKYIKKVLSTKSCMMRWNTGVELEMKLEATAIEYYRRGGRGCSLQIDCDILENDSVKNAI